MSLEWSDEIPNVTNVKVTRAKTVWEAKPSWIRKWKTKDHALEGFPAFRGPRGIVLAGWTGASKIYIRGDEHIIQLTERFGFRGKRHLDLATYDSIEVRHVPNQYFFLIGWMTVWMWGLGIIFIIWSYWRKFSPVAPDYENYSKTPHPDSHPTNQKEILVRDVPNFD